MNKNLLVFQNVPRQQANVFRYTEKAWNYFTPILTRGYRGKVVNTFCIVLNSFRVRGAEIKKQNKTGPKKSSALIKFYLKKL